MHRLILATIATLLSFGTVTMADAKNENSVTIYSSAKPGAVPPDLYRPRPGRGLYTGQVPGFAVVRHDRSYDIASGSSWLRVTNVSALIEPTTVTFQSLSNPDTRVLEQSFEFDLVSNDKLLQRYLGQSVVVEQIRGDAVDTIEGTLVGISGGLILQDRNGGVRTVNTYSSIRFPELPGGLITRPTLVWLLNSKKAGSQDTRISYQTDGMTWWADYNAVLDESRDCRLDLNAWVSIINQSGTSYPDARLKLIAGDVHRASAPQDQRRIVTKMAMMEADGAGFEEKEFFEYHLYTLGRSTDLPDNATKQLELFPAAKGIKCTKELVFAPSRGFRYYGGTSLDQNYGRVAQADIGVFLRFQNEKDNQLGIPLPAGRIRVNQIDKDDDSMEFIGEDVIDHTARDEQILIELGNAFDVVGERKQTDFRVDSRTRQLWESFEIKLRNHKSEKVEVAVIESLYRAANWKIQSPSHQYEKTNAHTIRYDVAIDPDDEAVVTYTVHYSW